ncbi:MAG: hypothetical protein KAH95_00790 [Spirochaetales bacterium]|nr:hypothetical protein [Spirochaetales bacterium]
MKTNYKPNFKILDEDEKELQNLDAKTAFSENAREAILRPYRSESRKSVTMRLPESVISGLKIKADNNGLSYQTLASMILQKYINGSLLDKEAVKEVVKVLQESN